MKRFTEQEFNEWLELDYNRQANIKRLIELNEKMISVFPFLLPKNRFTGYAVENFDYTYNEWSSIPYGWNKAFGYKLLVSLYKSLRFHRVLNDFNIYNIKEKWGHLDMSTRSYDFTDKIIDKYWSLSIAYCINCGRPVRYYKGIYLCNSCFMKDVKSSKLTFAQKRKFIKSCKLIEKDIPSYTVHRFGRDVTKKHKEFYKLWGIKRKNNK